MDLKPISRSRQTAFGGGIRFIKRWTTFSEIVTLCLANDACSLR